MNGRRSGALLHISSLPGPYGSGGMGSEAEKFASALRSAGFSVWQTLPVTAVSGGAGYSPYSGNSAFAGNLIFVSPENLVRDGLVPRETADKFMAEPSRFSDFDAASDAKAKILKCAWLNFSSRRGCFRTLDEEFSNFRESEKSWLADYAAFMSIKERLGGKCWNLWPEGVREHDAASVKKFIISEKLKENVDFMEFCQFTFRRQWNELRSHCRNIGLSLIGDIPMFMALDSSDVWSRQELFDLDAAGAPVSVAGVPPDYFSSTGQRWGNPLYRWDAMESDGFAWWNERIVYSLKLFDSLRIDHFRGFCGYWAIPASEPTAVHGEWRPAPGEKLFDRLMKNAGGREMPFIAEDLGIITDDVRAMMNKFSLPGMKVLLFAFGDGIASNPYIPHNLTRNSVIYTGTHDNDTVAGWWNDAAYAGDRARFQEYAGRTVNAESAAGEMCRMALASVSRMAVLPVQDMLSLGGECRMNRPGLSSGSWRWRLTTDEFSAFVEPDGAIEKQFRKQNEMYGRC